MHFLQCIGGSVTPSIQLWLLTWTELDIGTESCVAAVAGIPSHQASWTFGRESSPITRCLSDCLRMNSVQVRQAHLSFDDVSRTSLRASCPHWRLQGVLRSHVRHQLPRSITCGVGPHGILKTPLECWTLTIRHDVRTCYLLKLVLVCLLKGTLDEISLVVKDCLALLSYAIAWPEDFAVLGDVCHAGPASDRHERPLPVFCLWTVDWSNLVSWTRSGWSIQMLFFRFLSCFYYSFSEFLRWVVKLLSVHNVIRVLSEETMKSCCITLLAFFTWFWGHAYCAKCPSGSPWKITGLIYKHFGGRRRIRIRYQLWFRVILQITSPIKRLLVHKLLNFLAADFLPRFIILMRRHPDSYWRLALTIGINVVLYIWYLLDGHTIGHVQVVIQSLLGGKAPVIVFVVLDRASHHAVARRQLALLYRALILITHFHIRDAGIWGLEVWVVHICLIEVFVRLLDPSFSWNSLWRVWCETVLYIVRTFLDHAVGLGFLFQRLSSLWLHLRVKCYWILVEAISRIKVEVNTTPLLFLVREWM